MAATSLLRCCWVGRVKSNVAAPLLFLDVSLASSAGRVRGGADAGRVRGAARCWPIGLAAILLGAAMLLIRRPA